MRSSRSRAATAATTTTTTTTTTTKAAIAYPTNCKEIGEELSTDDLVRRLKDISMAFQQFSQDDDNSQYIPLAQLLSNDYYLEHSSKDVRLLVACSIADVFRVYAPNAPYHNEELIKKIFRFFIQQLRGLQDPKHPTFKRYFYLLENLAWVKSFNICIELEESQSIFCELFALIFSIVNDNHSDKVKNFMIDMLTPLILESDATSPELMEIIFTQLIEPKKSHSKNACGLAKEIIKKSIKTLGPYLINYLAIAITPANNPNGEENLESNINSHHKGSNNNQGAHYFKRNMSGVCDLIYELYKVVPETMQDFLPQLEYKIKTEDIKERCEFTKLLARLFSDADSNLSTTYPELWKCFLSRFIDVEPKVRMLCVQYSMHFLLNHPDMKSDITEQMKQRQHDDNENVRHEVIMAIVSAAKKGMDNINEDLLEFVKERTLDKKFKIRREALYGLAQLYRLYVMGIPPDSSVVPSSTSKDGINAIKKLSWVKNKCLHNYYQASLEDKLLVEKIVNTCLIPCSLPLDERVKVLYTFYVTLDVHAARAFNEMLRQQHLVRKQVCDILEVMREPSGAAKDDSLKKKIHVCSRSLLDPVKTEEYITKFVGYLEENASLREHLELIVGSASGNWHDEDGTFIPPPSSAAIQQSVREILRSLGNPVQTNSFFMIVKNLMERVAPITIDHEGVLMLLNLVSDSLLGDGELDSKMGISNSARKGLELLLSIANVFPTLFHGKEPFNSYLLPFLWLEHSNDKVAQLVLQILTAVGNKPFSKPSRIDSPNSLPFWAQPDDVIPRIIDNCILTASSPKQAKHALLCLNSIITNEQEKDKIFGQILDSIKGPNDALTLKATYFRTHLVACGMIATCGGQSRFSDLLQSIVKKPVLQGLLMKNTRTDVEIRAQERSEASLSSDNFDFEQSFDRCSEEVKCKVEAIKLLVRWLQGLKSNVVAAPEKLKLKEDYQKFATSTLSMCKNIILYDGDLTSPDDSELNEKSLAGTTLEKAHLRLAAANAMIKIAANDGITAASSPKNNVDGDSGDRNNINVRRAQPAGVSSLFDPQHLHVLATALIDPQEFVRDKFSMKLHKKLMSLELGLDFLAIFSLGGYFPSDSQYRKKLQTYLMNNLNKRRELVKTMSSAYIQYLFPDCTMPFVIHILAHMPFFTKYDDVGQLEMIKECLWFMMEPMVFKNDTYSFTFFKRTFESIKCCIDKLTAPKDEEPLSPHAQLVNYKIYCACDLALGLVMSKTQNFASRDTPIKPLIHLRYYVHTKTLAENNLKCYLPEAMQFPPPKRCGLEAEITGKSNKRLRR